jgi:hypothetical protein
VLLKEDLAFRGSGAGIAPTTWGQSEQLDFLAVNGANQTRFQVRLTAEAPPDVPLTRAVDALRTLVERHESLRTLFVPGRDGLIQQHVLAEGKLSIEIRDSPVEPGPAETASVVQEFGARALQPAAELPARFAVLACRGRARWLAGTISHLAADRMAGQILEREFATLLTGDEQPVLPEPARQPSQQAAFERSPDGQEALARALDEWRNGLTRAPRSLFRQSTGRASDAGPRYPAVMLRARGMALRGQATARRLKVPPAAVYTAAAAAVLGRATGADSFALIVTCANRWTPKMVRYVGTVAQQGLLPIDRLAPSFDELVQHVFALLGKVRHNSAWELGALTDVVAEVDGGDGPPVDHYVNVAAAARIDMSGAAMELRDGECCVEPLDLVQTTRLRFAVQVRTDDQNGVIVMFGDRRYLEPDLMDQLVHEIHDLVYRSADGNVSLT